MKLEKLAGATSEIWQVFIRDSSSTIGAGLAGLAFNSASLTAYYHRDTDTTATAITLATMTVGTFTSSGFKEIDATNMPGWYQFCPPNAAIASGAKSCGFHLKGATNMAPLPIEVQLTAINPDSATAFMTSVATVTTVTNQLTAAQIATGVWQDTTAGDFTTALSVGKSLMNGVALGTGLTVNDITTKTGYGLSAAGVSAIWQDTTAGDFTAANSIGKSIMNGVALGTGLTINAYTGNTAQTGDAFARLGAPAGVSVSADVAAIKSDTGTILTDVNTGAGAIYTRIGAPAGASIAADIATANAKVAGLTFTSAGKVDANALMINSDATAAADLAKAADTIVRGTCSGGTTTTAVVSTLVNPTTLTDAGQLIGRTIIFNGATSTANVQGQASNITGSTTGATPTITFTAMTTAPANGDTFVVV